jgi:hypothetical protein
VTPLQSSEMPSLTNVFMDLQDFKCEDVKQAAQVNGMCDTLCNCIVSGSSAVNSSGHQPLLQAIPAVCCIACAY